MVKTKIGMSEGSITTEARGIQQTLRTIFDKIEVTTVNHVYKNKYLTLTVTSTRKETFLKAIKATEKKSGEPRYTTKEQHMKMCEFIIKRAKLTEEVQKITGAEWEAAIRDLLSKVFKEDYDKRFDDEGEEDSRVDEALPVLKHAKSSA